MEGTRVTICDCSPTAWEHGIDYYITENFVRHKVLQFFLQVGCQLDISMIHIVTHVLVQSWLPPEALHPLIQI